MKYVELFEAKHAAKHILRRRPMLFLTRDCADRLLKGGKIKWEQKGRLWDYCDERDDMEGGKHG